VTCKEYVNNVHYPKMGHTHVGAADPCQTKLVTNFAAEQYGAMFSCSECELDAAAGAVTRMKPARTR